MKVVFWSPIPGQSGTTSNLFATAVMLAWKEKKKVLTINGQFNKPDMENAILQVNEENRDLLNSIGIDSLMRNAKMNNLNSKAIKSAALSFYNDYLQVITGTTKKSQAIFEEDLYATYSLIMNAADQTFEIVMVDAPAGKNQISDMMTEKADLLVVNLPQNRNTINEFFNKYPLKKEKTVFIIGSYSPDSKYNLKNLQRIYSCMRNKVSAVPYNAGFKDSFSDALGIKFMQKITINDYQHFHSEVSKAGRLILKERKEINSV